jgi:hypothetical protein
MWVVIDVQGDESINRVMHRRMLIACFYYAKFELSDISDE